MSAFINPREDSYHSYFNFSDLPSFESALRTLNEEVKKEYCIDVPAYIGKVRLNELAYAQLGDFDTQFSYTKHSFQQMVYYIKPPDCIGAAGYMLACPPPLRAANYNFWADYYFGANPTAKRVLLRTRKTELGPTIVACVSGVYSCINDVDLLSSIYIRTKTDVPEGETPPITMRSMRGDIISRYDMYWTSSEHQFVFGPNSTRMTFGVRVLNSEVGASAVVVTPMLYVHNLQSGNSNVHNYNIKIPSEEIVIRHVGQAPVRLLSAITNMAQHVAPFLHSMGLHWETPIPLQLQSVPAMINALRKHGAATTQIWYNLNTVNKLGELIELLGSDSAKLGIDEAEKVSALIGELGANGWNALL